MTGEATSTLEPETIQPAVDGAGGDSPGEPLAVGDPEGGDDDGLITLPSSKMSPGEYEDFMSAERAKRDEKGRFKSDKPTAPEVPAPPPRFSLPVLQTVGVDGLDDVSEPVSAALKKVDAAYRGMQSQHQRALTAEREKSTRLEAELKAARATSAASTPASDSIKGYTDAKLDATADLLSEIPIESMTQEQASQLQAVNREMRRRATGGKAEGDAPAAPQYTEAEMRAAKMSLFEPTIERLGGVRLSAMDAAFEFAIGRLPQDRAAEVFSSQDLTDEFMDLVHEAAMEVEAGRPPSIKPAAQVSQGGAAAAPPANPGKTPPPAKGAAAPAVAGGRAVPPLSNGAVGKHGSGTAQGAQAVRRTPGNPKDFDDSPAGYARVLSGR